MQSWQLAVEIGRTDSVRIHKDKLPEQLCGFTCIKDRRYGATGVTIYEKE